MLKGKSALVTGSTSGIGLAYARAFAKQGDYPRAAADFTQVLQLDPANRQALQGRGDAFERTGELDAAVADGVISAEEAKPLGALAGLKAALEKNQP